MYLARLILELVMRQMALLKSRGQEVEGDNWDTEYPNFTMDALARSNLRRGINVADCLLSKARPAVTLHNHFERVAEAQKRTNILLQ